MSKQGSLSSLFTKIWTQPPSLVEIPRNFRETQELSFGEYLDRGNKIYLNLILTFYSLHHVLLPKEDLVLSQKKVNTIDLYSPIVH